MARQSLSRLLVTLAVLAGALAWMGFTLQRTVFDVTRSQRVIGVLLEDETIRNVLLQRVANSIDASLPPELRAQVSLDQLTAAAAATLDQPEVRTTVERSLVGTQQYLIGEQPSAPSLDTALIDAVARQQLATIRPDLAVFVPQLPPIEIQLPAQGLTPVRRVRDLTTTLTPLCALVALCAAAAAVSISPNRPRTLRRLGAWAVAAGLSWVALRFALPALAGLVLPASAAVVAALAEAVAGSMAGPGVVMVTVGAGLIAGGWLLSAMPAPSASGARAPRPPRTARTPRVPRVPSRRTVARAAAPAAMAPPPSPAVPSHAPPASHGEAHRSTQTPDHPAVYTAAGAVPGRTPGGSNPAAMGAPVAPHTQQGGSMALPIAPSPAFAPSGGAAERVSIPLPQRGRPGALDGVTPPDPDADAERRSRMTPRPTPNEWLGGFSMDPVEHPPLASAAPPPPRWVEGVGYVYEYAPSPEARWIDGLGYVLDT